jgi:hypothetical protein
MNGRFTLNAQVAIESIFRSNWCSRDAFEERTFYKLSVLSENMLMCAVDELLSNDGSSIQKPASYFLVIANKYMNGERREFLNVETGEVKEHPVRAPPGAAKEVTPSPVARGAENGKPLRGKSQASEGGLPPGPPPSSDAAARDPVNIPSGGEPPRAKRARSHSPLRTPPPPSAPLRTWDASLFATRSFFAR